MLSCCPPHLTGHAQGEAEYYRPLVHRVQELSARGEKVVLTGHSLGGGLARIVASLTELPSVSFSPPGLELSHRKYSVREPDGTLRRLSNDHGALHHRSVAVVVENDWISHVDNQVNQTSKTHIRLQTARVWPDPPTTYLPRLFHSLRLSPL
jgi:alpha-beta hydrolase superfamily lysophospholipase